LKASGVARVVEVHVTTPEEEVLMSRVACWSNEMLLKEVAKRLLGGSNPCATIYKDGPGF
jgi:hypothetical protein